MRINDQEELFLRKLFNSLPVEKVSPDFTARTMEKVMLEAKSRRPALNVSLLIPLGGGIVFLALLGCWFAKYLLPSLELEAYAATVVYTTFASFKGIFSTIDLSSGYLKHLFMIGSTGLLLLVLDMYWRKLKAHR